MNDIVVLLVDDEELIRDVVAVALEEGGFSTIHAPDGLAAISVLDERSAEFSAVITDVNLSSPKASGWDVARHARELISDMPIIYMTGGNAHEWAANGVPNSILLTKPFAPAQVLTAVAQLLNKSSLNAAAPG